MICPRCGDDVKVLDTVNNESSNETYRRRQCKTCKYIFHTTEQVIEPDDTYLKNWWDHHRNNLKA